jgi:hypothetical protein
LLVATLLWGVRIVKASHLRRRTAPWQQRKLRREINGNNTTENTKTAGDTSATGRTRRGEPAATAIAADLKNTGKLV